MSPADQQHALQVLRLEAGDRLEGIDGRGNAWELEVESADRRRLALKTLGPARTEPRPGDPGAPLPWIEVWCPLPKGNRAEAMVSRLTQLGLARLVPLVTERSEVQARETSPGRLAKLERTARESLKQCGRLWMPEFADPHDLSRLGAVEGTRVLLDPRAEAKLSRVLGCGEWTEEQPLVLVAGPEGGLTEAETELLESFGVLPARLAPHVLRIETAVEAALAVAVESWGK